MVNGQVGLGKKIAENVASSLVQALLPYRLSS